MSTLLFGNQDQLVHFCNMTVFKTCFIFHQDDSLDHSLGTMTMSVSMSGTNLYEAARLTGGSSIMENLQSQLKLREGEIAQLQVEMTLSV